MKHVILALLLLLLAGCAPLSITEVKVVDDCGCRCLSWATSEETQCKVTYCEGTQCYTSSLEPEFGFLHSIGIPQGAKDITITAISKNGQTHSLSVK